MQENRRRNDPLRRPIWGPALLLSAALELVTIVFRFGFGFVATRDTAATIGNLTFGLRIHHGYGGAVMALVGSMLIVRHPIASRCMIILGIALVLSDLMHHFIVLWIFVGDPQFDLWYESAPLR